jgi:hypothetical protein
MHSPGDGREAAGSRGASARGDKSHRIVSSDSCLRACSLRARGFAAAPGEGHPGASQPTQRSTLRDLRASVAVLECRKQHLTQFNGIDCASFGGQPVSAE